MEISLKKLLNLGRHSQEEIPHNGCTVQQILLSSDEQFRKALKCEHLMAAEPV